MWKEQILSSYDSKIATQKWVKFIVRISRFVQFTQSRDARGQVM